MSTVTRAMESKVGAFDGERSLGEGPISTEDQLLLWRSDGGDHSCRLALKSFVAHGICKGDASSPFPRDSIYCMVSEGEDEPVREYRFVPTCSDDVKTLFESIRAWASQKTSSDESESEDDEEAEEEEENEPEPNENSDQFEDAPEQ